MAERRKDSKTMERAATAYGKLNRVDLEDLILSIQSAGGSRGRNGCRKDKSGEKLAESKDDLLEHRTDGVNHIS